jgi:3-isopropylmalate/(R)-2-methylmalate dehydratase small subunit
MTGATARVWRLGADVDTDQLAPGATMKHGLDVAARHCLEALRPEFAAGVRRGDVIVAGPNFGIGSSREQAASVLVHLGLAAVIAPSFGGLYFRNAFNVGLLLLTCPRAAEIADGEALAVDARAGRITRPNGSVLACEPIPGFLLEMVDAGGLLPQLKQRFNPSRQEPR